MNFIEKLDILMNKNGLNKHSLAKQVAVKYTTICSFYEKGYSNMKLSNFKSICECFGVTMDSMAYDNKEIEYVSDKNKQSRLSIDEHQLLSDYKELNEIGKARLLERSQMLIEDGYTDSDKKGEERMA